MLCQKSVANRSHTLKFIMSTIGLDMIEMNISGGSATKNANRDKVRPQSAPNQPKAFPSAPASIMPKNVKVRPINSSMGNFLG